jgi:hypothetical protein
MSLRTRVARITMVLVGTALAVPGALTLTAATASATGYALMYDTDGASICERPGQDSCP